MLKNKLLICAENVIMDTQTNSISVISILEDMQAMGLPFFIPRFSILHILEREKDDPETVKLHIKIEMNNMSIIDLNHEAQFQSKLRTRSIITLGGIPIQNPGVLNVSVTPENIDTMDYKINVFPPENLEPVVLAKSSS